MVLVIVSAVWALLGAAHDHWTGRVTNGLLLLGLLMLPWQFLVGSDLSWMGRVLGMSVAVALLMPGYAGGALGGGDLKLGVLCGLLWGVLPMLAGIVGAGVWAVLRMSTGCRGSFPFALPFLPVAYVTWAFPWLQVAEGG